MISKKLIAAAGNAGGGTLGYVEDVFSTYLYTGDGTTDPFPIVNGIDLANEGGLVWHKQRSSPAQSHVLVDTVRGGSSFLSTNSTSAATTAIDIIDSFNEDGFDLALNSITNTSAKEYATWTFRKAEKFFDVVTYTGTGTTRTVSHNLGSTPAVIIVKRLDAAVGWPTYHEANGNTGLIYLNTTAAKATSSSVWGSTSPTDTEFTVGTNANNINGGQFVAYLFASDAGGFGDDGDESIIKCGSYTGNGTTNGPEVDLGFEPQWLMVKRSDSASNWSMKDIMRGFISSPSSVDSPTLYADSSAADGESANKLKPLATGFQPCINHSSVNTNGGTYIYIAIRRPMKTPESGTEVFAIDTRSATTPAFTSNFPVDFFSYRDKTGSDWYSQSRLTGGGTLYFNLTGAENSIGGIGTANFDYQDGVMSSTANIPNLFSYMFKRATGFMDVVAYTSTTSAINHNLGVSPELVIYKSRTTGPWYVMAAVDGFAELNSSGAFAGTGNGSGLGPNLANATATTITGAGNLYGNGVSMVTYLFATVAGVSKVGSYTGNGGSSVQQIDCGFSGGARFILIKDVDGTNDWYVWDSLRGITAGNDPYLRLNNATGENPDYDWVDPYSAGFEVTTDATAAFRINVSGRKYIFLAIA